MSASLCGSVIKNLPAMQETGVCSLGWKIPWRRARQPIPVFLPGESPWTKEPGGLQSIGSKRIDDWSDLASRQVLLSMCQCVLVLYMYLLFKSSLRQVVLKTLL